MAPRGFTLPSAKTESARVARSAFFCTLCQKGYSRQNEFEAHESSYDHQHKKRLKEMKEMQKQAQPKAKEEKGPMISVKLGGATKTSGAGFKKGGFKNAFADPDEAPPVPAAVVKKDDTADVQMRDAPTIKTEADDSDLTDEEDYYDPSKPTGCTAGCTARHGITT